MKSKVKNILIAGVGGQGILLASEILSEVLMLAGNDVKKNEIHGMSQRGGSVVSHIRYGEKVFSPIIPDGEADLLLGFELLETYRYLPLVRRDGAILVNSLKIFPPPVTLGVEEYPVNIAEKISAAFPDTTIIDGLRLAIEAGNARASNTVLLGALSKRISIDETLWLDALRQRVPEQFLEDNLRAFALGRKQ